MTNEALCRFDHDPQRIGGAVGESFLEVNFGPAHLVGNMREADHGFAARCRKGIERGGFHLDSKQAALTHGFDGLVGLTEWRIGRPGRAPQHGNAKIVEGALESADQGAGGMAIGCRREE